MEEFLRIYDKLITGNFALLFIKNIKKTASKVVDAFNPRYEFRSEPKPF